MMETETLLVKEIEKASYSRLICRDRLALFLWATDGLIRKS